MGRRGEERRGEERRGEETILNHRDGGVGDEGLDMVQTRAIMRHIFRTRMLVHAPFAGEEERFLAQADMIEGAADDLMVKYWKRFPYGAGVAELRAALPTFLEEDFRPWVAKVERLQARFVGERKDSWHVLGLGLDSAIHHDDDDGGGGGGGDSSGQHSSGHGASGVRGGANAGIGNVYVAGGHGEHLTVADFVLFDVLDRCLRLYGAGDDSPLSAASAPHLRAFMKAFATRQGPAVNPKAGIQNYLQNKSSLGLSRLPHGGGLDQKDGPPPKGAKYLKGLIDEAHREAFARAAARKAAQQAARTAEATMAEL